MQVQFSGVVRNVSAPNNNAKKGFEQSGLRDFIAQQPDYVKLELLGGHRDHDFRTRAVITAADGSNLKHGKILPTHHSNHWSPIDTAAVKKEIERIKHFCDDNENRLDLSA